MEARRRFPTKVLIVVVLGMLAAPLPGVAAAPAAGDPKVPNSWSIAEGRTSEDPYAVTTEVKLAYGGVYPPFQAAGPSGTAEVRAGQPINNVRPDVRACGTDFHCFRYNLELLQDPEPGQRLRFAIDYQAAHLSDSTPDGDAAFVDYDVVILDADGKEVARALGDWLTQYLTSSDEGAVFLGEESHGNLEAFVDDPTDRSYSAVVIAAYVPTADSGFQPRVKLEKPYRPTPARRLMLPNVQPHVPYDLAFGCEAGDDPLENTTLPCDLRLRFSYGYRNAGDGPLHLEFLPATDGAFQGDVVQRVFREPSERNAYETELSETYDAGTYHLHASHLHYHYDPMFQVELFSYDPATGQREKLGRTLKVGNCGHDWFMADFMTSFDQDPRGTDHSDGCTGAPGQGMGPMRIGVSTGWGDTYGGETPDSYVTFAEETGSGWVPYGPGDYLLVQTVNVGKDGNSVFRETTTTDNIGYTHFRFTEGGDLCLLERGLGVSPLESLQPEPIARPICG